MRWNLPHWSEANVPEKLKNRLEEAGFKLKYTEPVLGANNENMHVGYIYAEK